MKPRRRLIAAVAVIGAAAAAVPALAASVDAAELVQLRAAAAKSGVVPVMAHMADVSLDTMRTRRDALRAEMQARSDALLAELGPDALKGGAWNNGMGQAGFYVTAGGLMKLQRSGNALRFGLDTTRAMRARVSNRNGSLSDIEAAFDRSPRVEVDIVFDLDTVSYELDAQGRTVARSGGSFDQEIADRLVALTEHVPGLKKTLDVQAARARILGTHSAMARSANAAGAVSVRTVLDRESFYALREREGVLALRRVGFADARKTRFDPEALKLARAKGLADVVLQLRGTDVFSELGGYMKTSSWQQQKRTHDDAIADILRPLGAGARVLGSHGEVGGAFVRMDAGSLEALYRARDPRLLGVALMRGEAEPALKRSARVHMNMVNAWGLGHRAKGQTIALLDTGVRKEHTMFKGDDGNSRVVLEACFGTTGTVPSGPYAGSYQSVCPSANGSGDSPAGTPGAGNERTDCSSGLCGHGTAVAGVAAGRGIPADPTIQGVGFEASIASVNVFSQVAGAPAGQMRALPDDIAAGLAYLYTFTAPGINPAVVNMSFGSASTHAANCDTFNSVVTGHVQNMISRGIPVVAATGNNSSRSAIAWPSCISNVVKVSVVHNDATATVLGRYANIGDPARFTGPMFVAPAGDFYAPPGYNSWVTTANVESRYPSCSVAPPGVCGPPTYDMHMDWVDTSLAAPHVSGFYAIVKAAMPQASVAEVTAWIMGSGSVEKPLYIDGRGYPIRFRMPRSPL